MAHSKARRKFHIPDGHTFAFSIIDDTDVSTVDNIRPFYDLLTEVGVVTTKTVWPVGCPEGSDNYSSSETLEDSEYLDYVKILRDRGFEISWHCATMESSNRERTLQGIGKLKDLLGVAPRVHANHAYNRENLYWGIDRIDSRILRAVLGRMYGMADGFYGGHREGSPYFWGDIARSHVDYVRNLTFADIDTTAVNPTMPYSDPRRPYGKLWFSASDAENADAFVKLLSSQNIDRLERRGGVCIVATHVGKGFVVNGRVRADIENVVRYLAGRRGWFVPVGTLLDAMKVQLGGQELTAGEWRRMQWRWAFDTFRQRLGLV